MTRPTTRLAFAAALALALSPLAAPAAGEPAAPAAEQAPATEEAPAKPMQKDALKAPQAPTAEGFGVYGSSEAIGVKAWSAKEIVEGIEKFDGKLVAVSGKVVDVCPKKGCWMSLDAGEGHAPAFVRFKDYSFFVPRDSQGHQATLVAVASKTEISEEMARHFLEDAGASKEEIEAVKGPQPTIQLMAVSVAMDRAEELDPPYGSKPAAAATSQPTSRPAATSRPAKK